MKNKLFKLLTIIFALTLSLGIFTACGEEPPQHTHNYKTLKTDSVSHWYECDCGEKSNQSVHNIIDGKCICGYVMPHTHSYKTLKSTSENHWYECECGEKSSVEAHKGGTATCTQKATCEVCNQLYGELIPHDYSAVVTAPTCTEEGFTTYTCACGDSYVADQVNALGHTEVIDEAIAPTCTATGLTQGVHCDVCKEILTKQEVIPANGHSYTTAIIAPTCTEEGYTAHTCICGDKYKDNYIDALGHDYQSQITAPTCTEKGYTTYTCHCGDTYTADQVNALGHTEVIDQALEPTCTETGLTQGVHCDVCQEVLTKQEIIPANGHDYVKAIVKATCTEQGYTTYTCHCGNTYVANQIDALGHTEVIDDSVAPTCTSNGLTQGKHCSVCETVLVAQKEIVALGHTEVIDEAIAPTCTITGLTQGKHCDVCKEVLTKQEIIPANGHDYQSKVTEPTCTAQGYTTYTCACGDSYVDNYVDAKGHTYSQIVTAPTCEEQGYTTYTCYCGDTYTADQVDALGHNYGEFTSNGDNTHSKVCANDSKHVITEDCRGGQATEEERAICEVCNEPYGALLDHVHNFTEQKITAKFLLSTAKCEKKAVYYYSCRCGERGTETFEFGEPNGHAYSSVVTAPTCTEQGYTTFTCHCGDTYVGNYVDALGHTEVIDKKVEPTCTATGLTQGKHCSVCKEVLTKQEIIPAKGHDYQSQITSPTCLEKGFTTYICHCGDTYVDNYVNAKGHDYQSIVTAPTCLEKGFTTYTCHCGDTYVDNYVNAKGHDYQSQTTPPTCLDKGFTTYTCHCGDTYVDNYVNAKGHDYQSTVTAPTCLEKGFTTYTCHCGDTYIANQVDPLGHNYGAFISNGNNTHSKVCGADATHIITENCNGGTATCTEKAICKDCNTAYGEPNGHNYSSVLTAPTCTEKGYTTYTCHCGDSYVDNYVNEKGHVYSNYVADNNATYEEDGTKTAYCDNNCGETDIIKDLGTKIDVDTAFATLIINNAIVYTTVNNEVSSFDFNSEITLLSGYNFEISTNSDGSNPLLNANVNLIDGDNIFYISIKRDNIVIKTYTITIRRLPIYTVEFITDNDSTVTAQSVQEGSLATKPSDLEKIGYTFNGWDFNFETPITENIVINAKWIINEYSITYNLNNGENSIDNPTTYTVETSTITLNEPTRIGYTFSGWFTEETFKNQVTQIPLGSYGDKVYYAKWTANTDTPYKVEYYFENIEDSGYTVLDSETLNLTGTTDTTATAEIKTFEYFTYNQYKSNSIGNIDGDGSTVLKVYYTRNLYTLSNNDTSLGTITNSGSYKYGKIVNTQAKCNKLGYTFIGWYSGEELLSTDTSYTFSIDKNVTAKFELMQEMSNFNFTSTATTCTITGIKDNIVTEIVVPTCVTSIKEGVFRNCKILESITLPFIGASASAKNGYDQVFGYIFGYFLKGGINSIDGAVYQYYDPTNGNVFKYYYYYYYIPSSIKSVKLSSGYTIPYHAFYNCNSLTSIEIPESVTSIGDYAFYNCYSLTSVTFGENNQLTSIGDYAFDDCSRLRSIEIPDSVTSIGDYAFNYCSSLTSVTFGENSQLTRIGSSAFYNCNSLEVTNYSNCKYLGNKNNKYICLLEVTSNSYSYTVNSNCKVIAEGAFFRATAITSITIPFVGASATASNGYDQVFGYIFGYTTSSSSYMSGATYQYDYALTYYHYYIPKSLKTVKITGGTSLGDRAFYNCSSLTSIEIPESLTSIGKYALYECSSLTSIEIPESLTSIGESAFESCSSLTKVNYLGSIDSWAEKGLAGEFVTAYNLYINNELVTDVKLASATKISTYAFYNCTSLTSIEIPESVTSIGKYAFSGCSANIDFGDNPTITTINSYAFSGYKGVNISIPSSVTSIGEYAFSYCSSLESIEIPESVTSIGRGAFYGCDSLTSITLPFVGASATASNGYDEVFGYIFGYVTSSYTTSGTTYQYSAGSTDYRYYIPTSLKIVKITGSTSISYHAFYKCSSLTSIEIPESVTSIGSYAFSYCSSLTSITFKDTSTWYRTTNSSDWQNKTGGNQTNVTNKISNVEIFTSMAASCYWYKI